MKDEPSVYDNVVQQFLFDGQWYQVSLNGRITFLHYQMTLSCAANSLLRRLRQNAQLLADTTLSSEPTESQDN